MSEVIRSFLAFELPGEIKDTVSTLHQELVGSSLNVRWVRPANVHLTVVFLGNVAKEDLPSLSREVGNVCLKYGRFEIRLRGMGVFGGLRSPRVLWIGLEGDVERMGFFRDAISKRITRFGVKVEKRPFRPHLTLGRFKKGARGGEGLKAILDKHAGLRSATHVLDELTLFKSELRPDGAKYTKIDSWRLQGSK